MSELKFYARKKKKEVNYGLIKNILYWIFNIVLVMVLAFVCVYCFGKKTIVIGQSMSSQLENGSEVLINRMSYKLSTPKRFDVIAFKPKGNKNSHYYVKRVIGLPGETVQIIDGKVYINEKELAEDIESEAITNAGIAEEAIKLGEDEYFVLGDNRNNSEDSRYANIGNVDLSDIGGKVWYIISPKGSRGFVK